MTFDIPQRLLECITVMGNQHTNAVLLTLNGTETIKPYQRYPAQPYYFGQEQWRVFYHCHDANMLDTHEHGHFHFFTRAENTHDWSHVIVMGMNQYGLPINLFTTNLWVTDGQWFDAREFEKQLAVLQDNDEDVLPLSWFKYMLLLFKQQIHVLLQQRDAELERVYPCNQEQAFFDRTIYFLSHTNINLEQELTRAFATLEGTTTQHEVVLRHG